MGSSGSTPYLRSCSALKACPARASTSAVIHRALSFPELVAEIIRAIHGKR
jgi:hypothetical protein